MSKVQKSGTYILFASLAITGALALAVVSPALSANPDGRLAQATPPTQTSPAAPSKDTPAESKPGGTRPTTPAPEPARPSDQAQKEGAKAALPPAPPEKIAPPMPAK